MKARFEVQHTGRPYGPCERIPESRWQRISTHATLSAARKRLLTEKREMRRTCGQGAWSDHFRVAAAAAVAETITFECGCSRTYTLKQGQEIQVLGGESLCPTCEAQCRAEWDAMDVSREASYA